MAIKQRSKGSWQIRVDIGDDPRTGKRKRVTETLRGTKAEATAREATLRHQLATGVLVEPSKETVGGFLERWLRDYVEHNVAPSTARRYRDIVRLHVVPHIGHLRLRDLRPGHLTQLQRHWLTAGRLQKRNTKGLAPRTVLQHHRVLHEALEHAVKWQVLGRNPLDAVDAPRIELTEARTLDLSQAEHYLQFLEGKDYATLIATAMFTGLRLGELIGLRWRDVDLERGRILVRQQYDQVARAFRETKSHRGKRALAIDQELVERLQALRQQHLALLEEYPERWAQQELVFSQLDGTPVRGDAVRRAHYRYLRQAGLPRVKPHELRHTHASHLIASGASAKLVQERLGHATPAFTLQVYGHLLPGEEEAAIRRLSAAFQARRAKARPQSGHIADDAHNEKERTWP